MLLCVSMLHVATGYMEALSHLQKKKEFVKY